MPLSFHLVSCVCGIRSDKAETTGTACTFHHASGIPSQIVSRSHSQRIPQYCSRYNFPGSIHPARRNHRDTPCHPPPPHTEHCRFLSVHRPPGEFPQGFRYNSQTDGYTALFPFSSPFPTAETVLSETFRKLPASANIPCRPVLLLPDQDRQYTADNSIRFFCITCISPGHVPLRFVSPQ